MKGQTSKQYFMTKMKWTKANRVLSRLAGETKKPVQITIDPDLMHLNFFYGSNPREVYELKEVPKNYLLLLEAAINLYDNEKASQAATA